MAHFETVALTSELKEGQGKGVSVGDHPIAIFMDNGLYYAIEDRCPHAGAPLSCGHIVDGTVTCAWHAWRFRLKDGAWMDNPKLGVTTYDVRVTGDLIQVLLPDPEPPHDPEAPEPEQSPSS